MFAIDSLVVAGLAVLNLGTINEGDGVQERQFWLRNAGDNPVTVVQGYTSCGCTTISYDRDAVLQKGDSTKVVLRFNPANRGDEFYESGTIAYTSPASDKRRFVNVALQGVCVLKSETLLLRHPVAVAEGLRISSNRFDLGYMTPGQEKRLTVSTLLLVDGSWQQGKPLDVSFTADASMPKGLQHVKRVFPVSRGGKTESVEITYDVIIK